MSPKIAIIGAGPGGLCVANILQRNNISFSVFELDKSPHERNQGGSLDLHPRDGQLAMKEAGLWDAFCRHSRPEADVMKLMDLNGEVFWDSNGPDAQETPEEQRKPEIDREKLKDILFENIKPGSIRFGLHLDEVVAAGSGKWDLHFREGVTEGGFDLVIGAEGAWSKVRKVVSNTTPHYSGISALELWANDVDETNPWLSGFVGGGNCFSFGDGRAIQAQRQGNGSIRTYASLRQPETFLEDCGIDFNNQQEARNEYVERYFDDVAPELRRLLLESNSNIVPRALYMLPVGFRYEHKQGITLLGDAAHLMTPFAGVGVNAALADALELSKTIIKFSNAEAADFDAGIRKYETEMFERGERYAKKTYEGLQGHFSADGAERFARRIRNAYAAAR